MEFKILRLKKKILNRKLKVDSIHLNVEFLVGEITRMSDEIFHREPGSVGGFVLLNWSFSFPLLPQRFV